MSNFHSAFSDGVPARILIVEDERIVALDLRMALETLGFQVVAVASTKDDAVRMTMSYKPDLVLMDINLGDGGNGIEAAEEVMRFADIPVVFLTAYADNLTLRRAAVAAPYGYLVKPIQSIELNATIQMALARVRLSHERFQVERRLRLALDSARMGVVTLPKGGDFVQVDGHFPPIASTSLRGLRMGVDEFLDHLSKESQEKVTQILSDGKDLHFLARWVKKGSVDEIGWMEVHAGYVESESAIVGVCREVTKEIDREDKLRQAAVVFEAAADAILILNIEGQVTTANPAFTRLTGWDASEIRGKCPNSFLHARRFSDQELISETPLEFMGHAEVVCFRKNGSSFPAWEHLAPVRNESGEITHRVLTFTDISALRFAESRVRHLAYHDPLTGLGNRNQLKNLFEQMISTASGDEVSLVIFFVDLDGFKFINDSLGHEAGDLLLIAIAERIRNSLRHSENAIRLGGDEFLLLANCTNEIEINGLAERLLESLRQPVELPSGQSVRVSASMGIAVYPTDGTSCDTLLRSADIAMYAAKAAGRNRFARYHSYMASMANERLALEQGLQYAISEGGLSIYWQPQVSIDGERLIGAEALLRWNSNVLGSVAPDRFIPIAEECGLIHDLGRWVLVNAIGTWAKWRAKGIVSGVLSINVSAIQLQDESFVNDLANELQSSGLPAGEVELEITETAIQDTPNVHQVLGRITELGVRIALDDFGTGYSSLAILKLLPLKKLKIDRSFIRELSTSASDKAIVEAITAISSAMDLEVIAEGVETEMQRVELIKFGIGQAQGWLFAKAMNDVDFVDWVVSHSGGKKNLVIN